MLEANCWKFNERQVRLDGWLPGIQLMREQFFNFKVSIKFKKGLHCRHHNCFEIVTQREQGYEHTTAN